MAPRLLVEESDIAEAVEVLKRRAIRGRTSPR